MKYIKTFENLIKNYKNLKVNDKIRCIKDLNVEDLLYCKKGEIFLITDIDEFRFHRYKIRNINTMEDRMIRVDELNNFTLDLEDDPEISLESLNESQVYDFSSKIDWHSVVYSFTNKDNFDFFVTFAELGEGKYIRSYKTYQQGYSEINTGDVYSILKTITEITIDFINKYSPNEIKIEHMPNRKEYSRWRKDVEFRKQPNKRALLNKRFLENSLPSNYKYELDGHTTIITKI
jgi:hypothetical protein